LVTAGTGGLVSAVTASATSRGSLDLTGFTSASFGTGTAGTYSFTTSDRGTITLGSTTDISTDGGMTALTVNVGADSTLASTSGAVISAAGTIAATSFSVAGDGITSGALAIGQASTVHTAASVSLAETAANAMELDLIGATFTSLTVTLDGSAGITANSGTYNFDVTFDSNTLALEVFAATGATKATVTSMSFDASSSTGINTIDVSYAASAVVYGGTAADSITGTAGADTLSGGAGADSINGGTGNDTITAGTGADSILGGTGADSITGGTGIDVYMDMGIVGNSIVASATSVSTTIAAADTWTFTNGVDYISDFAATDLLDLTTAATAPTTLIGFTAATALVSGTTYVVYGTLASGVFTAAAAFNATSASDALVVVGNGTLLAATTTGIVVLDGLTAALVAGNIV